MTSSTTWVAHLSLALVLACGLAAQEPNPTETVEAAYARYLREGQEAAKAGNPIVATRAFAAAVESARQLGAEDLRLADALALQASYLPGAKSIKLLQEALAIREKVAPNEAIPLAKLLCELGRNLRFEKRLEEAKQYLERADRLLEGETGREAARVRTGVLEELAYSISETGTSLNAEPLLLRSLRVITEGFGANSSEAAGMHRQLANYYMRKGFEVKVAEHFREAAAAYEAAEGKASAHLGETEEQFGRWLWGQGQLEAAIAAFERAMRAFDAAFGPRDLGIARNHNNIGSILQALVRYAEAEAQYRKAWNLFVARYDEHHEFAGLTAGYIGNAMRWQEKNEEAQPWLRRALSVAEAKEVPDTAYVGDLCNDLGRTYLELGQFDESERHHRRALAAYKKTLTDFNPKVQTTHAYLARVKVWRGQGQAAEPELRTLLEDWLLHELPQDAWFVEVLEPLAWACAQSGKHAEAAAFHERIAGIYEQVYGAKDLSVAGALDRASTQWRNAGQPEAALKAARRAVDICERLGNTETLGLANALFTLGASQFDASLAKDAIETLKRALDLHQKVLPAHAVAIGYDHQYLAAAFEWLRDWPNARLHLEAALRVYEAHRVDHLHHCFRTMASLGIAYMQINQPEASQRILARLLEDPALLAEPYRAIRAEAWAAQATAQFLRLDFEAAAKAGAEALPLLEADRSKNARWIASLLATLGRVAWFTGKTEDARLYFMRAKNMMRTLYGEAYWESLLLEGELGAVDRVSGNLERARTRIEAVLPQLARALPANDVCVAVLRVELAVVHEAQGRIDKALELYAYALPTLESMLQKDHLILKRNAARYAAALRKSGKESEANRLELRLGLTREEPRKPEGK